METKLTYSAPACRLSYGFVPETSFLKSGKGSIDPLYDDPNIIEWDD